MEPYLSGGSPIIDHVLVVVSDFHKSKRVFEASLRPLGLSLLYENGPGAGFGIEGHDDFAIHCGLRQVYESRLRGVRWPQQAGDPRFL